MSEEDQVLRERVDKLNEEINILNSCSVSRWQHTNADVPNGTTAHRKSLYSSVSITEGEYPSRLTKSPRSVPVLVISSSGSFEDGRLHDSGIIHQSIDEQTVCDVQCTKLSEEDRDPQVTTLGSSIQHTGRGSNKTVMQLHKS